MDRLDPKLDLVFKLLLTRQPQLLQNMIEGILARPLESLTVLNPDIPGELVGDKEIVLDIRVLLADGARIDVEMQIRVTPALAPRLVYYAARDYADQLGRGDGYDQLTPTVVVVWLLEPLFPGLDRLHSIFELRELATEDPIMAIAKHTLEELSRDPESNRLARERADAVKLYQMDLAAVRAEARAEGRAEERAEVLLKLLGLRFGPLSATIEDRVREATPERLERCVERVLTAETLDEVFAP